MKIKFISAFLLASFFANTSFSQSSQFEASVKELKAILDVPALGTLINYGKIKSIKKIEGTPDIFEIDTGFCKAQVRIVHSFSTASNPTALSLGAECGP